MPKTASLLLVFASLAVLSLAGCGGHKYQGTSLSGSVTVGGQPIEKGTISFVPTGDGPVVSAPITNGSYTTEERVPVGKVRVTFIAIKETGATKTEGGRTLPETVSLIPDKYKDGIEKDITASDTKLDFALDAQ